MYSGGTPVFVEDNIFEIVIPMRNVANLQVGPEKKKEENSKEINSRIIDILKSNPEISVKEIAGILGVTVGKARYYIEIMKKAGILEHKGRVGVIDEYTDFWYQEM